MTARVDRAREKKQKLLNLTLNTHTRNCITGGLAQLARAPALHAGGHRFDSDILHSEIQSLGQGISKKTSSDVLKELKD